MYASKTYDEAVEFFGQNAGLRIYPGESENQARLRAGQEYAAAEMTIREQSWSVGWLPDWEIGSHLQEYGEAYSDGEPDTCEVATLYNSRDEILASLGCIDDATNDYRRVVDAELALEAMSERKIDLVECGTCERKFPDLYPAARCPFEYNHEGERGERGESENKPLTITISDLYTRATNLVSEEGENPEYDRALIELLASLLGLDSDDARDTIATRIGAIVA
jgi:hypothetical protein